MPASINPPDRRSIRRQARSKVQDAMRVRAFYLADGLPYEPTSNSSGDLPELSVRVHERQVLLGDQAGTSLNSAERQEATPHAIFWRDDLATLGITLERGAVISVSEGEAYQIDYVDPHDVETIKAAITRLSEAETTGLPVPE